VRANLLPLWPEICIGTSELALFEMGQTGDATAALIFRREIKVRDFRQVDGISENAHWTDLSGDVSDPNYLEYDTCVRRAAGYEAALAVASRSQSRSQDLV
jgi:hypothetical protein